MEQQKDQIATALAKAQGEFSVLEKKTQAYNYKYADLAEIMSVIQEPLQRNGLSLTHEIIWGDVPCLKSTLIHSSGQELSTPMPLFFKADGKINQMQALGSAITYAKRYTIGCLLNLAADKESDDDGKSSSNPKETVTYVTEKVNLPKVTAEQVSIIDEYLEEFPESRKDMLARYGVIATKDIPADKFDQIVFIFDKKRKVS